MATVHYTTKFMFTLLCLLLPFSLVFLTMQIPPYCNSSLAFIMAKIRLMNQVRIKMKRKKFSTRFAQIVVVTVVLTLFLYFIFQAGLDKSPGYMPDFSWLSTRNVTVFVRPEENTVLVEPRSSPCRVEEDRDVLDIRILIAVFSAPRNSLARATIR